MHGCGFSSASMIPLLVAIEWIQASQMKCTIADSAKIELHPANWSSDYAHARSSGALLKKRHALTAILPSDSPAHKIILNISFTKHLTSSLHDIVWPGYMAGNLLLATYMAIL